MIDVWMLVAMIIPFCEILSITAKQVTWNNTKNGKQLENIKDY